MIDRSMLDDESRSMPTSPTACSSIHGTPSPSLFRRTRSASLPYLPSCACKPIISSFLPSPLPSVEECVHQSGAEVFEMMVTFTFQFMYNSCKGGKEKCQALLCMLKALINLPYPYSSGQSFDHPLPSSSPPLSQSPLLSLSLVYQAGPLLQ